MSEMAAVYFASLEDGDVVHVELSNRRGDSVSFCLFVDSGFTGESCLILSEDTDDFALANVSAAHTSGALHGRQRRILVDCRIPAIAFQRNLVAIVTDLTSLSLPPNVVGMVGLSFLRQFDRWGGERSEHGDWQFFLSDGEAGDDEHARAD
jgi:hypothetical protein